MTRRAVPASDARKRLSGREGHLRLSPHAKATGAYYTPPSVIDFLVDWAVRGSSAARVVDPSCGDGRFLQGLSNAVGVDVDRDALAAARRVAPTAKFFHQDFFSWSLGRGPSATAVVGNPPFIRFQRFAGHARASALRSTGELGLSLSGVSSSWAFFVACSTGLLIKGGRLAMVVPSEISYAVYARPLVKFLLESFESVQLFAPQEKLFPELSEDCWLLRCEGFGRGPGTLTISTAPRFSPFVGNWSHTQVDQSELEGFGWRLRPFLLPEGIRRIYAKYRVAEGVYSLGQLGDIGIGYVSGANDFFHLTPTQAKALRIPARYLQVAVRSNADLAGGSIDRRALRSWYRSDKAMLLLKLPPVGRLPPTVERYLRSPEARSAREGYKCRNRKPWYSVPDVRTPHAFLAIMSGLEPRLVKNEVGATCTNSVHSVRFRSGAPVKAVFDQWSSPLTQLSCEVEGHHLGGGLLKLEPVEARRVVIPIAANFTPRDEKVLVRGLSLMRAWRVPDVR